RGSSSMDKQQLVAQLRANLEASARAALAGRDATIAEARDGATPDEKREDARAAHQRSTLGSAQQRRAREAIEAADQLTSFRPPARVDRIMLGAIVEIEDGDTREGRTFFLAPVGAGVTLTGPGG